MRIKTAQRKCPICTGSNVCILHSQAFVLPEGHSLSNGYDVVSCQSCGFVYADVNVSQDAYNKFYARFSKYSDPNTSTGGGENVYDLNRLVETTKLISSHFLDKNINIIDIGCANGGLLREIKNLGYRNVLGIDPSPVCVENCLATAGVNATIGSISSLPSGIGTFDIVILSHVLEHIQDLSSALATISKLLTENGEIYAEVPDATRYADFIAAPFQDFNTEHINHFSLNSLKKLFNNFGFVPTYEERRSFQITKDAYYPVISVFFIKANRASTFSYDAELVEKIQKYIGLSKAMLSKLDDQIAEILNKNDEIIVWGTGQLAMKLLAETCLGKAKIVAFVDGNPINQGKVINSIQVISPKAVSCLSPSFPILITTLLHHQSILDDIERIGIQNDVFTLAS